MKKKKDAAVVAGTVVGLALLLMLARKAGGAPLYVCDYCGVEFATEEELLQHIEQEHPQPPPPTTNLSGTVKDSTGKAISGAWIGLDGLTTYTDISGAYAFYGLTPDTVYAISVDKEYYNPFTQTFNVQLGDNLLHMTMDPATLQSVTVGIRTRSSRDDLPTPSASYKSRPCMQVGYARTLLGSYISNSSYYTDFRVTLATNPITNKKWQESDLIAYRFGVWLWASAGISGATRCTQIWLEAQYSDGATKILRPYSVGAWQKVADIIPDEDEGYIYYTTSGGTIPGAGGYFTYLMKEE